MWADVYKGPDRGQTNTYCDLSLKGARVSVPLWSPGRGLHVSLLTHAQGGAGQQVSSEQQQTPLLPASNISLQNHHHREAVKM